MPTDPVVAQLNVRHFRGLRLGSLQTMAFTSVPLWFQAHGLRVPAWLAWLSLLVGGCCLALAIAYALLESRWRRDAGGGAQAPRAVLHVSQGAVHSFHDGVWSALAAVSLIPWLSIASGRPLPAWALGLATSLAAFAGVALLVVELIATGESLRASRREEAGNVGSDAGIPAARRRLDDAR